MVMSKTKVWYQFEIMQRNKELRAELSEMETKYLIIKDVQHRYTEKLAQQAEEIEELRAQLYFSQTCGQLKNPVEELV
jgi:hypothetical protein